MKWANHEMCHIRRIGKENCIKLAKEKMSREILDVQKPQQKKKKKKKLAGMFYRNLSCHI